MDIPETANLRITIDLTTEDDARQDGAHHARLPDDHNTSNFTKDDRVHDEGVDDAKPEDIFRHKKKRKNAKTAKSHALVAAFEARLRLVPSPAPPTQELVDPSYPDVATEVKTTAFPDPVLVHVGRKKTIFTNIAEIARFVRREEAHLTAFLFWELGTNGKPDDDGNLVIKGIFKEALVGKVVGRYRGLYVTCKSCTSDDTLLTTEDNPLQGLQQPRPGSTHVVTCNACGSESTVPRIRSSGCRGLTVGKRRTV
ncbi:translation initiation factor IF2/IF5 [Mytilinidion resinicola]|uniref:Translation initiation factor IF2/IF5 n=1 Tax=Mytilinidion resinicola TaxID=574789 RepID=A0A6A6Y4D2_9PEZI|nr:translation initiation factor IF2/IF5 [Mytilinidion resinicola]KAF2803378.1 translation initiation factor IF2/IF5 [Mytilinidion resinicola]